MDYTLMLVKPDAVQKHAVGRIIAWVEEEGFVIEGLRMLRLTREQAERFYAEHRERPFFAGLVAFMTSGPTVALLLRRDDAVSALRVLIGATDSRKANEGTIRAAFGVDNQMNAVHASDSPASAARETAFFFNALDRIRVEDG